MQVNRIQSNIYSNRPNFNGLGGADKIAKALESKTTKVVSQNRDGRIIEDFYDFNGKKTKTIVKHTRGGETYEEYYDSDGKEIKSVLKDPIGHVIEIGEKIYDFKNRLKRSILKEANGRIIFDTEFGYRGDNDYPTEMTIKGANGKILSKHA